MLNKFANNRREFGILLFIFSTLISIAAFVFRDTFKDALSLGLLGILIINFFSSATFFISGPAFLTVIAGGGVYSPLLVALIASLGTALGDSVSFFFGYSTRHIALKRFEEKLWFKVIEDIFKAYGGIMIFFFSLIPNPLFDGLALVAGVFKYDVKRYFVIVLIARFLRFIVLAQIGDITLK